MLYALERKKMKDHLEDPDIDGRIKRKWVSKSRIGVYGVDLFSSG
jgi:hypothetical protein